MQMSMNGVYVDEEMYDKALPHLTGTPHMKIQYNGVVSKVPQPVGLTLEYGPGLFTPIKTPSELRLACRLVVGYHDDLRTQSEQSEIEDARRDLEDTALLEAACTAHMANADDSGEEESV
jgi:hypothetical protein